MKNTNPQPDDIFAGGQLLTPEQLGEYLGISKSSVYQLNHKGCGPAYIRIGKAVRYAKSDVKSWLERNRHTPAER